MIKLPDFTHERALWAKGYHVIGVDEVGRGSLAGPVVVSAVCFSPFMSSTDYSTLESCGINDSKKLTHPQRCKLSHLIRQKAAWATAASSVDYINKYGIVKATARAVREAVADIISKLNRRKCFVLVDAFYIKHIKSVGLKNQRAIIHGDEISLSIAAASIVAKVHRDNLMQTHAKKFPSYLWGLNKGYGTKAHIEAIRTHGTTKLHRDLYVRNFLA